MTSAPFISMGTEVATCAKGQLTLELKRHFNYYLLHPPGGERTSSLQSPLPCSDVSVKHKAWSNFKMASKMID